MVQAYPFLLSAHLIAMALWVGALTAVYWMLRLHDHASGAARDQLTLMERALALSADICITVVIICGVAMIFGGPDHAGTVTWFGAPSPAWLHIKLLAVLLMLAVHGVLRGRIKKFSQGKVVPVPGWLWSSYLVCLVIAIIAAVTKFAH
ncbi:MAG TPA: CopD family protein [Kofleriaceae bacterium]|jgi:uncharacterized membrane protein